MRAQPDPAEQARVRGLEMAAQPPYILLPAFLVQSALCFHLVLLRRLTIMPEDMPREQIQRSMSGNEMW